MKTKLILSIFLALMAGLILFAILDTKAFLAFLNRPELYEHARFVHIAAATIFFANAVLGMLWEGRALASGRKEAILHTYETVAWLDARLSSPLIILSLVSGLMLAVSSGDFLEIGWMSWSLVLFILSGITWVLSDIPTQYRVKRLMASLEPSDPTLPSELVRLLKLRLRIGIAGVSPLVAILVLMVYKPGFPGVASLFR